MGSRRESPLPLAVFCSALLSRDERDVLAVIAFYSLFIGFQMFLSMFYLQRNLEELGTGTRSKQVRP